MYYIFTPNGVMWLNSYFIEMIVCVVANYLFGLKLNVFLTYQMRSLLYTKASWFYIKY